MIELHRPSIPSTLVVFALVAWGCDGAPITADAGGLEDAGPTDGGPPPDETAPTVVEIAPADASEGVARDTVVRVTFSEPVFRVNATTMTLLNTATGELVPGTVRYLAWEDAARFVPDALLEPNTRYRVRLAGWIVDAGGNRLGYRSWGFTTGI